MTSAFKNTQTNDVINLTFKTQHCTLYYTALYLVVELNTMF